MTTMFRRKKKMMRERATPLFDWREIGFLVAAFAAAVLVVYLGAWHE